ncbi:hypothetical protein ACJX0J_023351, partial [Zea mays]
CLFLLHYYISPYLLNIAVKWKITMFMCYVQFQEWVLLEMEKWKDEISSIKVASFGIIEIQAKRIIKAHWRTVQFNVSELCLWAAQR